MTMCLAAKAQFGGDPRIVFCCDFLAANDYGSYEDVSKYFLICDGLMGMYSGPLTTAREVSRLYPKMLKGFTVTEENVFRALSEPMEEFRRRFAARSKSVKGPGGSPSNVEVLIFGFVESVPRIFHMSQADGDLEEEDLKWAIGSGAQAAWTMLEWRGLSEGSQLDHVLYAAFEAKKLAEAGPPVGKRATMLAFLEPLGQSDFRLQPVFGEGLDLLNEAFQDFGPKRIAETWNLPRRVTHPTVAESPQSTTRDSQSPPPSPE